MLGDEVHRIEINFMIGYDDYMLFVVASIASSCIFDMRPVVQHRISGRFYAMFIADFKVFRRSSFNFQCTRNINFLGNFYLCFPL